MIINNKSDMDKLSKYVSDEYIIYCLLNNGQHILTSEQKERLINTGRL
jgi:hypothetical protein